MDHLVSVIIATHNSSQFVIETLESVSKQTWKDIELIITDDCSEDDTVELCSRWLSGNRNRFTKAEVLKSDKNTGISANANRGLYAANGEWIKLLGADDTLYPNCVEDNMTWISSHPEIRVLFSQIEVFKNTFEPHNLLVTTPGIPYGQTGILAPSRSAESQYRMLLLSDRIHFSPSVFLNRETLISVGGFDERFRLFEDYPLWLNLTKRNHKLYFMDKVTVKYRRHSQAAYNKGLDCIINPNYFLREDFRHVYTYPNIPLTIRLNERFVWYGSQVFRLERFNVNSRFNRFLLALLTSYLNPFKYYIHFRKMVSKNLKDNEFYM
jgi:glycosyltransferase involved in cell wall biosynthesis